MKTALLALTLLCVLSACAHKPGPPQAYHITSVIPPGSKIEFYGQIHDDTWKHIQDIKVTPRPMRVKEAEKWAISAANERLGKTWKDYYFRVLPPNQQPVVVFHRRLASLSL